MMSENDISYEIRGAIFKVFNEFGPGLFESVYKAALAIELANRGLNVEAEVPVPVFFEGQSLGLGFKLDLLVEDQVLIEVKSVETLGKVHHKQVLTYLGVTGLSLGILVNFNESNITKGIFRKISSY